MINKIGDFVQIVLMFLISIYLVASVFGITFGLIHMQSTNKCKKLIGTRIVKIVPAYKLGCYLGEKAE